MSDFYAGQAMPGPGAVSVTSERNAILGPITWYLLKGIVVKGSATSDAGHTPTTELRHGLLLGQRTGDGLHAHYQPNATDGTQRCLGFLWTPARTLDTDGNTVDRPNQLCVAGYVIASQLLLLDEQARTQLKGRFIFDDRLLQGGGDWIDTQAKTANYTVVNGQDNGVLFTTTGAAGAVNFTLGNPATGNAFTFMNTANQNLTVTAPAGKLVAFNNAAATSVSLQTAAQKIGGGFEVVADETGSFWIVLPITYPGQTITVA
jgi:hypothetical protein